MIAQRLIDRLSNQLFWVSALAMVAMMMQIVADIAGKYLFSQPVPGTLEIVSAYYMVAVVFLPLGLVQRNREHIAVDLFTQMISARTRDVLERVVYAITAVYMAILCWMTTEAAIGATQVGESLSAIHYEIPIWPGRWFLPIGSAAMMAHLILQSFDRRNATCRGCDD